MLTKALQTLFQPHLAENACSSGSTSRQTGQVSEKLKQIPQGVREQIITPWPQTTLILGHQSHQHKFPQTWLFHLLRSWGQILWWVHGPWWSRCGGLALNNSPRIHCVHLFIILPMRIYYSSQWQSSVSGILYTPLSYSTQPSKSSQGPLLLATMPNKYLTCNLINYFSCNSLVVEAMPLIFVYLNTTITTQLTINCKAEHRLLSPPRCWVFWEHSYWLYICKTFISGWVVNTKRSMWINYPNMFLSHLCNKWS